VRDLARERTAAGRGRVMPGSEKSTRYFQVAAATFERAEAIKDPTLKAKFKEIAARYRDLASEIDESSYGEPTASAQAELK
jgi:hypothetical protein